MDLQEGHARDFLIAGLVVGGILLSLFLYTGNWPPPVVVESNSMMHVDQAEYEENFGDTRAEEVPYGRFGTIDPGDLVLVKKQTDPDKIKTFAHGQDEHYGMPGEVVVYFPNGQQDRTPIIHRAMTWVDVERSPDGSTTYDVVWSEAWEEPANCRTEDDQRYCTFESEGITIRELGMDNMHFQWDGFITKGDNVAGNTAADQRLGIVREPVRMAWVEGIARGELPWFGLIKLMFTGEGVKNTEVADHPYYWSILNMNAPQDLWIMLVVGLAVVGLAPVGLDYAYHRWRQVRDPDRAGDAPPGEDPPPPPDPAPGLGRQGEGSPVAPDEPSPATDASGQGTEDPGEPPGKTDGNGKDRVEIDLE